MGVLRDITGQYLQLLDLTKTEDLPIEAILDTLEGIEGEFKGKALKVVDVIQEIEGDIQVLDSEIERLQARKKVIENKNQHIRNYLKENMEACGIDKISCPLFTITLAKGREMVIIDDLSALPDEFVSVKAEVTPDKRALLKALKEGPIEGAHLDTGERSLRIK